MVVYSLQMKYAPCATTPHKVLNVISSDFSTSLFTVYMTSSFIIALIITENKGVMNSIPCSYSHSLPSLFLSTPLSL